MRVRTADVKALLMRIHVETKAEPVSGDEEDSSFAASLHTQMGEMEDLPAVKSAASQPDKTQVLKQLPQKAEAVAEGHAAAQDADAVAAEGSLPAVSTGDTKVKGTTPDDRPIDLSLRDREPEKMPPVPAGDAKSAGEKATLPAFLRSALAKNASPVSGKKKDDLSKVEDKSSVHVKDAVAGENGALVAAGSSVGQHLQHVHAAVAVPVNVPMKSGSSPQTETEGNDASPVMRVRQASRGSVALAAPAGRGATQEASSGNAAASSAGNEGAPRAGEKDDHGKANGATMTGVASADKAVAGATVESIDGRGGHERVVSPVQGVDAERNAGTAGGAAAGGAVMVVPVAADRPLSSLHQAVNAQASQLPVHAEAHAEQEAMRAGGLAAEGRTIVATPSSLEVGLANGTHGWLKIRAEMYGDRDGDRAADLEYGGGGADTAWPAPGDLALSGAGASAGVEPGGAPCRGYLGTRFRRR
ncbi:MAG: hypothetical protein PW789_17510 [Edaphobacter sp.]|uniref:hypothetical protein n=1 Tax=Edaphobacter sp. TaxID=1934404 RepID=UPI0023852026|nr:hypothetical protein [Edaphobacter sp.]MDE1178375.1 hypothetical protein [Edaphobacter sp.]